MVHIREQKSIGLAQRYVEYVKLCTRSSIIRTCQNDLGFSLYTMLSACCMVTISENWTKSKVRVSTNVSVLLLNTRD